MARYEVYLKRSAAKELGRIPRTDLRRVVARIRSLAKEPRPAGSEKLSAQERYRIRQGDYRIVYSVQDDERTVWVVKIGHRREVYRA
jgi:mRNA interferase RelE/StbE